MISAVVLALNDPALTWFERFERVADLASLIEGGHVLVCSNLDDFQIVAAPPMPPRPMLWPALA
jgi:hypothetical protein